VLFALVANRAVDPMSKLSAAEWASCDAAIPGLAGMDDDQAYRAMDLLVAADTEARVQEAVFFAAANLLNLEVDLLFFDTTSTFFQRDTEESGPGAFRVYGHSKDHRPDLPQVVIGLAVTREGIPVRCWCWPGNTNDMTVLQQVKDDLRGWRLGRVITVVDRGFASDDNLAYLTRAGGHWIADQLDHDLVSGGRPAVPPDPGVAGQPLGDPVPPADAQGQAADGDRQSGLGRQARQPHRPRRQVAVVAAAQVDHDTQPLGVRAGVPAHRVPPAPQGLDREAAGVVVGGHLGQTRATPRVGRRVGRRIGQALYAHLDHLARRPRALVDGPAGQPLLAALDRHDRLTGRQVGADLLGEVADLGVTLRPAAPPGKPASGLQPVALLPQQPPDRVVTHAIADLAQRVGQLAGAPGSPAERACRVVAVDERLQRRQQAWVGVAQALGPAAGPAHAPGGIGGLIQLGHAAAHGRPRAASQLGDPQHAAAAQGTRHRTQHQATLPLGQVRQDKRERRLQDGVRVHPPQATPTPPAGKVITRRRHRRRHPELAGFLAEALVTRASCGDPHDGPWVVPCSLTSRALRWTSSRR
jgi:Transposase DDE domain